MAGGGRRRGLREPARALPGVTFKGSSVSKEGRVSGGEQWSSHEGKGEGLTTISPPPLKRSTYQVKRRPGGLGVEQ